MLRAATFFLAIASCAAGSLRSATEVLQVQTTGGTVRGHVNEVGVRVFKGIPYAEPPVGDLRWEAPFPAKPFNGVYEANYDAPGCPQLCNLPPGNCPAYGQSEDCLYLSVFAPPSSVPAPPSGYPVFFWIHGGAFEQGLGNCALYNGSTFALNGVLTIAINYRLGVLGYMAASNMQGNYGIMDQRVALQWAKNNVAAFGGDPNRITIGGQSAGAMSVGAHLISPNSKGLFSAAVMESNPLGLPFHTRETASENAKAVFEYLNCAERDVACMRSKSTDEILDAQANAVKINLNSLLINFLPFAPMTEPNGDIPEQPLTAIAAGNMQSVPMLSGSVLDEGHLFVQMLFTKPLDEMAYNFVVKGVFGVQKAKKILKKYPFDIVPGTTDGRDALNVLATDLLFYCPLRNITRGYQRALGPAMPPSYLYRFTHVESFDCWGPEYAYCVGIVCHGSELPYVFNVFSDGVTISYNPTADEVQLATDMGNAWTNFITSGNPNNGLPVYSYPAYAGASDELVIVDEPDHSTVAQLRSDYCDMWDEMGYFY